MPNPHLARALLDQQAAKTQADGNAVDYSAKSVTDLKAAIAERNAGRDDQALIKPAAPGNKPELITALEADDAAQAAAENTEGES